MKSVKNLLIVLLIFFVSSVANVSFAQTGSAPKKEAAPSQGTGGICDCLKGAIDSIQKAYVSLEEDEWPTAIKATKDAITSINTITKNCACPETIAYQKIAEAYLKYAEGENHLDDFHLQHISN